MGVVCFDTNVVIWGTQAHLNKPANDMLQKTRALITSLTQSKTTIIIPSIVVGEVLIGLPEDQHTAFMQRIQRQFMIVPYDFAASRQFASIWRSKRNHADILALKGTEGARTLLRADAMIVATAVHNRCTCIYSNNEKHLRSFAGDLISIKPVPDFYEQSNLI